MDKMKRRMYEEILEKMRALLDIKEEIEDEEDEIQLLDEDGDIEFEDEDWDEDWDEDLDEDWEEVDPFDDSAISYGIKGRRKHKLNFAEVHPERVRDDDDDEFEEESLGEESLGEEGLGEESLEEESLEEESLGEESLEEESLEEEDYEEEDFDEEADPFGGLSEKEFYAQMGLFCSEGCWGEDDEEDFDDEDIDEEKLHARGEMSAQDYIELLEGLDEDEDDSLDLIYESTFESLKNLYFSLLELKGYDNDYIEEEKKKYNI